jgi:hypothetical protein
MGTRCIRQRHLAANDRVQRSAFNLGHTRRVEGGRLGVK